MNGEMPYMQRGSRSAAASLVAILLGVTILLLLLLRVQRHQLGPLFFASALQSPAGLQV